MGVIAGVVAGRKGVYATEGDTGGAGGAGDEVSGAATVEASSEANAVVNVAASAGSAICWACAPTCWEGVNTGQAEAGPKKGSANRGFDRAVGDDSGSTSRGSTGCQRAVLWGVVGAVFGAGAMVGAASVSERAGGLPRGSTFRGSRGACASARLGSTSDLAREVASAGAEGTALAGAEGSVVGSALRVLGGAGREYCLARRARLDASWA